MKIETPILRQLIESKWEPARIDGTRVLYQGRLRPIPPEWKNDTAGYLAALRALGNMEWEFTLPGESPALFQKRVEALTKDLPPNWSMIILNIFCVIIVVVHITKIATYVRSKL